LEAKVRLQRLNQQSTPVKVKITNMNEYTSNRDKRCFSNPLKRLFRISDKTLVILDERIVSQSGIADDDNVWVEQILTDEGITLKIRKNIEEAG
jgi:hypothetical protein